MLCLGRKTGEKIVIGEGAGAITITVLMLDRNKVRLGISAPRDTLIMRAELLPPDRPPKPEDRPC